MKEEKDFFKTCFDVVAGLEVQNETQAIAKEVVLDEIENLQSQLKAKEKVIKEAREETKQWIGYYEMKAKERYDQNTSVFVNSTCKKGYVMDVASKLAIIDLILSKGENK